ncbi:hypothetical protein TNCV_2323041 [Trichonephila clavipes]|nr:hypothetical protein TNCV_2323041 [Trichonephila clavipes]
MFIPIIIFFTINHRRGATLRLTLQTSMTNRLTSSMLLGRDHSTERIYIVGCIVAHLFVFIKKARLISEIIFVPVSCLITTAWMAAWKSTKIVALAKQSIFFLRYFRETGALGANRYPGVCPQTNAVPGADGTVPESTVDPYQGSYAF